MDEEILQQIFDELLSSFEPLETQTAALVQFLKAKGIATDEELAPFLEQAGNASNVRWRAARVRIRSLISSAMKPAEPESAKTAPKTPEPAPETSKETVQGKKSDSDVESAQPTDDNKNKDDENKKLSKSTKSDQAPREAAKNKEPTKDKDKVAKDAAEKKDDAA
jgi:hypothetical protein